MVSIANTNVRYMDSEINIILTIVTLIFEFCKNYDGRFFLFIYYDLLLNTVHRLDFFYLTCHRRPQSSSRKSLLSFHIHSHTPCWSHFCIPHLCIMNYRETEFIVDAQSRIQLMQLYRFHTEKHTSKMGHFVQWFVYSNINHEKIRAIEIWPSRAWGLVDTLLCI